jgi:SAM-dependent methyltransferase
MRNLARNYEAVFENRGDSYDRAMAEWPRARQHEFATLLSFAAIRPGDRVCDFPSGGGYMADHIRPDADLTLLETSPIFYDLCRKRGATKAMLTEENTIPFPDGHFDTILSLAGLHHNPDQPGFFREAARALKPGARLCVADVAEGSPAGEFLNVFVDEHNSEGHAGRFFDAATLDMIRAAGLVIERSEIASYPWVFDSAKDMADFCVLLFGIDRASPAMLLDGLRTGLGYTEGNGRCAMNWQLHIITAVKPIQPKDRP